MKTGKDLALEVIKNLIDEQFKRFGDNHTLNCGMLLQTNSDDSLSVIYVKDNSDESINKVYNRINEKYRDHVIGFSPKTANFFGNGELTFSNWELEFEPEYQEKFYKAMADYNTAKAAWCAKYGCD